MSRETIVRTLKKELSLLSQQPLLLSPCLQKSLPSSSAHYSLWAPAWRRTGENCRALISILRRQQLRWQRQRRMRVVAVGEGTFSFFKRGRVRRGGFHPFSDNQLGHLFLIFPLLSSSQSLISSPFLLPFWPYLSSSRQQLGAGDGTTTCCFWHFFRSWGDTPILLLWYVNKSMGVLRQRDTIAEDRRVLSSACCLRTRAIQDTKNFVLLLLLALIKIPGIFES